MPPKSLRQTQLKRKRPSSSTPIPMVPTPTSSTTTVAASSASAPCPSTAAPPSPTPTATATPSSSAAPCSPSLTATTTPVPPPLLCLTATEGEPSMAMVTGETFPATEAPRSIRCRNKDGKAPVNPRKIMSAKTARIVKATGGKLKVDFSPFHKRPGQKDRYYSYVRDLGAGVRKVVPMLANTWGKLKPEHRASLTDYMQMYYDVPTTPEMEEFFKKKASSVYKEWKYDCHMHYLEFGGEDIPLEFVQRPEQWRWLVKNDFEDEKQQAICE